MNFAIGRRVLLIMICVIITMTAMAQEFRLNDSLSKLLDDVADPRLKAEKALNLSKEGEDSNIDQSLQLSLLGFEFAEQNNDIEGMMNALNQLSKLYFKQSNYVAAIESAEQLRDLAIEHKSDKMLGRALIALGSVFGELGFNEKTSELAFSGLKIFEKIDDKEGITESLGYIGILFSSQGQRDKALEYLDKALYQARKINDLNLISQQLNNIAIVYLNQMVDDTAIKYFRESLSIDELTGDKLSMGIKHFNIGFIEMKRENFEEGYLHFQKAKKFYAEIGNQLQLANSYLAIGHYYYQVDSLSLANSALQEALKIGVEKGYNGIIMKAAVGLQSVNLEENDTISAYKFAMIQKEAQDELHASQNQTEVSRLELQYKYEKEEFERQLNQQKKNNIYSVVFISMVLGLIILALLYSRNKLKAKKISIEKKAVEQELDFKKKELGINLLALMKKNEMLTEISGSLVDIKKGAKTDETKEALTKITKKIRNNADDKIWNEFSIRFQEVHAGFYEKLLQSYPELTQNELKLCAFLRLNMSTKDIAELTGQRILTLENARYRLRKKLGISNSEVNLVTFLSQVK